MSAIFRSATRAAARPMTARAFSTTASRPVARITIVGNLGDTPELQATSTGREILRYNVASNSGPRDNRHTSWFRVTSFVQEGPQRDFLMSLPKGSLVMVDGDVKLNKYEDTEGKTQTAVNVTHRSIEVLRRPYNPEGQQGQ